MAPFPLNLTELLGHWESYIVYLVIGFAFGAVLEMAGFAQSTKLAAQFYFKDQTVLKVMFTGIVVAMLLIFLATGLGLLDYNLVWVNPTYLWPGIIGGLIMGAGFIIGGFCPGTSLVAAATLKLDGIFFALGAFFGIFLFGETVSEFEDFWYSSDMGRYTLPEMFGTSTGVVVLGVVLMALAAFAFAEFMEHRLGKKDFHLAPQWRYYAAGGAVALGIAAILIGQPSAEDRWNSIRNEKEDLLADRAVQIHPGELLETMANHRLRTQILDVRSETDYNLFHLNGAIHVEDLNAEIESLLLEPANTVFVVISNDEKVATAAWKTLTAESVPNVYILEGGINGWLDLFADESFKTANYLPNAQDEELHYRFDIALGARHIAARPNPDAYEFDYEKKVKLKGKGGASGGGCG